MKLIHDTWLVFRRHLLLMTREPIQIVLGVAQPVIYLILFAPLLKKAFIPLGASSTTQAYRIYVPGMLAALALGSGLYVGFSLLAELSSGVIERARVTSISRAALLLGRVLRDVCLIVIQAAIITVLSLPFGLFVRIDYLLLAYLLLALITMTTASISYGIALKIRSAASMGSVINNVAQPLMLLSGTLLPLTLAPIWLQDASKVNPFSWAVAGMRAIFAGHIGSPHVWQSMVIMAVLMVVALAWSTRLFARSVR